MKWFPPRLSLVLWLLLFGVVLSQLGAPDLVIRIPWSVLWAALALLVGLGVSSVVGRRSSVVEPTERFPEVYEQDIAYTPAHVGPTVRLTERIGD